MLPARDPARPRRLRHRPGDRRGHLAAEGARDDVLRVEVLRRDHLGDRLRGGEHEIDEIEHDAQRELAATGWNIDYVSVRRRRDLRAPEGDEVAAGEPLVVLAAAKLGTTRLIDNMPVLVGPGGGALEVFSDVPAVRP